MLVHLLDSYEDNDERWKPQAHFSDVSGSLIFGAQQLADPSGKAAQLPLFEGVGGFVLRPHDPWAPTRTSVAVRCGNGADAGGHCHAFCKTPDRFRVGSALARDYPGDGHTDGCSWRPEDFAEYLTRVTAYQQATARLYYNEITIDATSWRRDPEGAIEAIFIIKGAERKKANDIRDLHQRYRARFGLGDEFPLLELDLAKWGAPFRSL